MRQVLIFSIILAGLFFAQTTQGQEGVTLLEPSAAGDKTTVADINEYIQGAFKPFLGLLAALSVVMIVWGGLEYIFSDVISNKAEAKKRIWAAVLGLLLALGSYLLLKTINPQIVETPVFQPAPPAPPPGDTTFGEPVEG